MTNMRMRWVRTKSGAEMVIGQWPPDRVVDHWWPLPVADETGKVVGVLVFIQTDGRRFLAKYEPADKFKPTAAAPHFPSVRQVARLPSDREVAEW